MKLFTSVDAYISSGGPWQECLLLLREILASSELEEQVKWGMPVYTLNNKNVAGFSAFKSWCALWFYQGVYLKDPAGVLINAQEGVTKGLRQWRFTSLKEIRKHRTDIQAYLEEAIQNQKAGKEIKTDRNKTLEIPRELEKALVRDPALKDRFEALSFAKRRDFAEHVASAKRQETRQKRLEKILPLILEGIGLNDKYKK
jgi:uncharacterized protein YdeI (YjbR/CyaY-like superfamily)